MSKQFQQWVRAYQGDVWGLARYLLRDPSEAEDVTQETFLKLWKASRKIGDDGVKPWLLRVARNACLDRLRRPALLAQTHPVDAADPAVSLQYEELGARLRRAIASLPEPQRSLVVLRDVQQLSYREVAQIMQLSDSQVKVYLHRARARLRSLLTDVQP